MLQLTGIKFNTLRFRAQTEQSTATTRQPPYFLDARYADLDGYLDIWGRRVNEI